MFLLWVGAQACLPAGRDFRPRFSPEMRKAHLSRPAAKRSPTRVYRRSPFRSSPACRQAGSALAQDSLAASSTTMPFRH